MDFSVLLHLYIPISTIHDVISGRVCSLLCSSTEYNEQSDITNAWIYNYNDSTCECVEIFQRLCGDELGEETSRPQMLKLEESGPFEPWLFVALSKVEYHQVCLGR